MSVARERSRLVKLIFPIASMIGRASNLVMSICSTGVDNNCCLRVSLIADPSISSSVVISCSNGAASERVAAKRGLSFGAASPQIIAGAVRPPSVATEGGKRLQLHDVRACGGLGAVEARHRLVIDDR